MTKEEKLVVINAIAEQLQAYPHFYIADIEALNAEQTAALRRKCYESDIKLVVVKNTLKAAFAEGCVYVGDNQLDALCNIKSKEELIGDIIALLQSPAKNVISALQANAGQKIAGIVKTLESRNN